MKIEHLPIGLMIIFIFLSLVNSASAAEWFLYFTERDTSCPDGCDNSGDYNDLYVLVDDTVVWSEPDSGKAHLGLTTVNITDYVIEGTSGFSFVITHKISRHLTYLKDIYVSYKNNQGIWENVSFTPFTYNAPATDFRANIRRETDIYAAQPGEAYWGGTLPSSGDNLTIKSSTLEFAPELQILRSELKFDPEYPDITSSSDILINATIRNTGSANATGVQVKFWINDVLADTSSAFDVPKAGSYSVVYDYSSYFGGRDKVTIEIVYAGTEGLERNNEMTKFIVADTHHPFLYGNIESSYGYNHLTEEPYASMASAMNTTANSYISKDYLVEDFSDRCKGAHSMGLRCAIYGDVSYCNKSMEALLYLGDGTDDWIWFNRSEEGDGVNKQEYGYSSVHNTAERALECAIGYDMIANYIADYDSTYSTNYNNEIMNKLLHLASDLYLLNKEYYFSDADWTINRGGDPVDESRKRTMALCSLSGALQGATGSYEDVDGNPWEWFLFCNESFIGEDPAGRPMNLMRWGNTEDGLMREGYYRFYNEWAVMHGAVNIYYAFGENWHEQDDAFRGFIDQLPFTNLPNGLFPSRSVGFNSLFPPNKMISVLAEYDPDRYSHYNWWINETLIHNEEGFYPYGSVPHEAIFTYNHSAPHSPYPTSTFISKEGSMAVLRSDWDDDALWMWLIIEHDGSENGHVKDEGHQLSFSVFGKRAFPLVDSGDPRWLNPSSERSFSHRGEGNNYLAIDGKSISLGNAIIDYDNPAYLAEYMTDNDLDYIEGEMDISKVYKLYGEGYGSPPLTLSNPVNATRAVLFPSKEYFIVMDNLMSTGSHDYDFILHYGGTEIEGNGDLGEADTNSIKGNLTLGSNQIDWWDEGSDAPTNYSTPENDINNITWITQSLTDSVVTSPSEIRTTIFFEPAVDAIPNRTVAHWGRYGEGGISSGVHYGDYWHPFTFNRRTGSNIKSIMIIYLTNETAGDSVPEIGNIPITGGSGDDYAAKIINGNTEDYISVSDGEVITADALTTDAAVAFSRSISDNLQYFFIRNGTTFHYSGTEKISISSAPDYTLVSYAGNDVTLKIKGSGSSTMTVKDLNSLKVYAVKRDGAAYSNWVMQNGNKDIAITSSLSEHTFEIYVTGDRDDQDPGDNGNGGGSPPSSSYTPPACEESWECGSWSACGLGIKTRTCEDKNDCGTIHEKPAEQTPCCENLEILLFPIEVRINNGTVTSFIVTARTNCNPDTVDLNLDGVDENWYTVEKIPGSTPGLLDFNISLNVPPGADIGKIYMVYQPVSTMASGPEYNSILEIVNPKANKEQSTTEEPAGEAIWIILEVVLAIILAAAVILLARIYKAL